MMDTATAPTRYELERAAEVARATSARADLLTLAHDVAHELDGDWTATDEHPDYPGVYLTGPDGAKVYLRFQGYREYIRLDISTSDPEDVRAARIALGGSTYSYGIERREISVAWGRGAKVTAREITRRLLPGYAEQVGTVRERLARDTAAASSAQANADAIAAVLGQGPTARDYKGDPTTDLRWSPVGDGYARIEVGSDTVRLERASIPVDKFLWIAAILAED